MKKRKTYNQPKKVVGKTPEQKRNQIYAYILAFAMIFWTIASVLGVIGFFKTCDSGVVSASAEDVDTRSSYIDQVDEVFYGAYDLHLEGATCVVNAYRSDKKYAFFNSPISLYFLEDNSVKMLSDDEFIDLTDGEVHSYYFEFGFIQVGDQEDILLDGDLTDYCFVSYSNDDNFFISTSGAGCYIASADIEIELDDGGYLIYDFLFNWRDFSNNWLGTSVLSIGFDNYYTDDHAEVFYPYCGVSDIFDVFDSHFILDGIEYQNYDEYLFYQLIMDESYQDGYTSGRADGYQVGREDGFTQGVASANEYSFNGLFSSIFDVPVKTFTSLFSFDILGVDLSGLFFSILTVGIILAVVKWLIP